MTEEIKAGQIIEYDKDNTPHFIIDGVDLSKIIDCKNGTIASLVQIRDELKEENTKLKEALKKIKVTIEPCKASDSCFTCKFEFCANYEIAKILKEALNDKTM